MRARPGGTNSAAQSCTLLHSPDGRGYEPAGTPGGVQTTHKRHAPPEMQAFRAHHLPCAGSPPPEAFRHEASDSTEVQWSKGWSTLHAHLPRPCGMR